MAGFFTTAGGVTDSFLKLHNGKVTKFAVPGASATNASGLNGNGWIVGFCTVGAATHGIGSITLNGINNENDIVGFSGDSVGNTDGLAAFPSF